MEETGGMEFLALPTAEFLIVQQQATTPKTQVQAWKDKPLTKYPSYVYEYGRSCCLSEPLSIAETAAAEFFSFLCAGFCGRIVRKSFVVVTPLLSAAAVPLAVVAAFAAAAAAAIAS